MEDGRDVAEILVRRSFVHMGRTMGFTHARCSTPPTRHEPWRSRTGPGIKLGDAPPGFRPVETGPEIADGPSLPPLHAVFRARAAEKMGFGSCRSWNAWTASTLGPLHIGPIHILLGARRPPTSPRARPEPRRAPEIEDWNVAFVARGTNGPFTVDGAATLGRLGRVTCRLTLKDQGREGRAVASAVALFRASP